MDEESRTIARRLASVDWDFRDAVSHRFSSNSLHWYPGTFVPQIPSVLVQLLSQPGDCVLDPFAGSGTTGIEAMRLGRRAVLIDNNSASVSVMRGKAAIVTGRATAALQSYYESAFGLSLPRGTDERAIHPELALWYHKETLVQLNRIWALVRNVGDVPGREALELLFADTLFACASTSGSRTRTGGIRRHHWGWVADNVKPRATSVVYHDATELMSQKVRHAIEVAQGYQSQIGALGRCRILQEDARSTSADSGSVDLVITAPPYINMIDYALANRLTFLWMGWDLEAERREELGARYRRRRSSTRSEYLAGMTAAIDEIVRVLRPGGYLALIVGASRTMPAVADAVIAIAHGCLSEVGRVKRQPTHRRISERKGTDTFEIVGVFRK